MFSFSFSVSEVTLRDLKNNSLYLKKFEKLRKKIEKTRRAKVQVYQQDTTELNID